MTHPDSVFLDLLGTQFSIETNEPLLFPLLQRLWSPFLISHPGPNSLKVQLVVDERNSHFRIEDNDAQPAPGPWGVLIGSRNEMVALALDNLNHLIPIHAAAVARGRQALLIAGESFAGKTRLAVELLSQGWHLLSDDAALLDPGTMEVHGFPKPLGMRLQPWDEFRKLWEPMPAWLPDPPGPYLVPADSFTLTETVTDIRSICFLDYEPAGPDVKLTEVSTARAIALCTANMRRLDELSLRAIRKVCSQATCINLRYADYSSASIALHGFLGQVFLGLTVGGRSKVEKAP